MELLEQTQGLVNGLISILQHKHQLVISAVDSAVKCYLNLLFIELDGTVVCLDKIVTVQIGGFRACQSASGGARMAKTQRWQTF